MERVGESTAISDRDGVQFRYTHDVHRTLENYANLLSRKYFSMFLLTVAFP